MHWLARQLLRLAAVLFCVTLLTFLIVNILPGDVAIAILGAPPRRRTSPACAPTSASIGRCWCATSTGWARRLSGDLGRSYRSGEPVAQAIAERLPVSLQLMVMAQIIALGIAVPAALLSVRRPGGCSTGCRLGRVRLSSTPQLHARHRADLPVLGDARLVAGDRLHAESEGLFGNLES